MADKRFDNAHLKKMIIDFLIKFGKIKSKTIEKLIILKLSSALSDEKKKSRVTNFLSALRIDGKIKNLPGYFWEII